MRRKPTKKEIIVALVTVIVIGALVGRYHKTAGLIISLVGRYHKTAGLIISLVAIGLYLVAAFRPAFTNIVNFKRVGRLAKITGAAYLVFIYIFARGIINHDVPYFLLLLTFGLEYLIYDNKEKE